MKTKTPMLDKILSSRHDESVDHFLRQIAVRFGNTGHLRTLEQMFETIKPVGEQKQALVWLANQIRDSK